MTPADFHKPVLLAQVIEFLDPAPGKFYIDATIGGGGHSFALLQKGAKVLGIDRDPEAIEFVDKKWKMVNGKWKIAENLTLVQGNFSHIGQIARENGFSQVNGILFDLGVSSHQLETPKRGFSFQKEGPPDMRMDPNLTVTAYDIINNFNERRIHEILKTYGQEKFSRSIARAICSARQVKPIKSTIRLAKICQEAVPRGVYGKHRVIKIHPATRTFQALRIVVNSELLNLGESLPQTTKLLAHGGRLAIITFHSLEAQIVKRFLKQEKQLAILSKKPIGPSKSEILQNPRARSARLRVAEKI